VVGGTGLLGRRVVAGIVAGEQKVRVLTRDANRPADPGVELAQGDLRDAASLAEAVAGCTTVIAAAHGFLGGRGAGPEAIDRDGNRALIRTAAAAGVRHVVLLSVHRAAPDHPMSLHRMKYAAEQTLRGSGLGFTIVRPSAYYETWTGIVGAKLGSGGPAMVFGRGRNPISFVSVADVARVVLTVLDEPSLRGQTFDVGGPENLTMSDFAQRLVEHAGGDGRVRHLPLPVLRAMSVLARPVAPAFARMTAGAVAMDTVGMTMDPGATVQRFPDIAWRTLADVLAG
jgi:uncharacterized protein YbjT (DUF2867 family)